MKINIDLLKKLYLIEHPSRHEYDMTSFIINWCYNNIKGITFQLDHYCNLFITKNTTNPNVYPCLIAHMDEAQSYPSQKELIINNGVITAKCYDEKKKKYVQCGLGADDANGICVALQLLEELPNLKVCFTVEEEIGAEGAHQAALNTEFFSNCQYLIQADRRGKSDLICHTNGIEILSDTHFSHIADICDKFEYELEQGTFTDVGIIAPRVGLSGMNVSCGYDNEHMAYEMTVISELENCLNFIYTIITSLDNMVYPFEECEKSKAPDYWSKYGYSNSGYSLHNWDNWIDNDFMDDLNYNLKYSNYQEHKHDYAYYDQKIPCDTCRDFDCQNCDKYDSPF